MTMKTIAAQEVITIHDGVITKNELQGLAKDKSIESVIARIENRLAYSMINDVYELAACYATYIAHGHAFNDANKRTAFAAMCTILILNDIYLEWDAIEVGDKIRDIAQHTMNESDLTNWLRLRSASAP